MQDHLKERLTGAAILVAAVVLLVPELFHGRTPADHGTAPSTAGPPVRSVTIDLGDSAGARPLTENAPAAAPEPSTTAATPAPLASAPPAAVTPPRTAATPPAAPPPAPAAAQARATAAPPATAASNAHGAVKSGWTVQLGSFSRRDFAERMVRDAAAKGFTVEVAGPDDRGLYRVRSPPRADRAAALALKQKMQASGYKPIVNKVP